MTPITNITEKEIKEWRFVIVEIKSSQNPSKQIPLPTGLNGVNIREPGYELEKPLLVPFTFVRSAAEESYSDGWVRNKQTNKLEFKGDRYDFRILELPNEYQTLHDARQLIADLNAGQKPISPSEEMNWDISNVEWGLESVPKVLHLRDIAIVEGRKGKKNNESTAFATGRSAMHLRNTEKDVVSQGQEAALQSLPREVPKGCLYPEKWIKGYDAYTVSEEF